MAGTCHKKKGREIRTENDIMTMITEYYYSGHELGAEMK